MAYGLLKFGTARKVIVLLFHCRQLPKGKALVTAFEHSFETQPVGGVGLNISK